MIAQAIEKINILLQGRIPSKCDPTKVVNEGDRKLAEILNQLVTFMEEMHQFIIPLASGELNDIRISPKNFLVSPFKELHSRLRHLTWQAKQVSNGDYAQRVDFMGEFSEAFNFMIIALERNERLLREKICELEQALSHIKKLEGILPICSFCKRIRQQDSETQDRQSWIKIENYLSTRTNAQFSHCICPECMQKHYPEYAKLE